MILSRYLFTYPHPELPDRVLVFSTRKSSLIQLPQNVLDTLRRGDVPGQSAAALARLGIIVSDPASEYEEVRHMLAAINLLNPKVRVSVILGMDCNFSCQYCYEGSLKGRHAMDDATMKQLVVFLKSRYMPDKKKMVLDFYGGEPLLYTRRIEQICRELKPFVEDRGGTFKATLVTNGSLLTAETVNKLLPLGLHSAKITIDGPAANHNLFRPFKSGRPSFDAILDNLREIKNRILITLAGNFTARTCQLFPRLLDTLESAGLGPDNFSAVKFDAAMQISDTYGPPEFTGGCSSMDEPWLVDASLTLRQEIMKRGYPFPALKPSPCMVDVKDSFTIHYNGDIYKCAAMAGRERFTVGDIWKGISDYSASHHTGHWQKEKKCRECAYLPLCFGGCRYMAYQRTGSMAAVDCQKKYLDKALGPMLLQDVRFRYGKTGQA